MTDATAPTNTQMILHAEREIGKILATLEQRTGQMVERIHIRDIDVTKINDTRQMLSRQVVIDTRPQPGSNWVTT